MCYFDSNLITHQYSVSIRSVLNRFAKKLLNDATNRDEESVSLSWENCSRQSSKIARKLIKRPSYLPQYMEIMIHSWFFISINNSPSKNSYLEVFYTAYSFLLTVLAKLEPQSFRFLPKSFSLHKYLVNPK